MRERTDFWRLDIVKKRVSERACKFFEIPTVVARHCPSTFLYWLIGNLETRKKGSCTQKIS
ncbi:hypothetical protein M422DRAFT_26586 [Sphaerobolus stellatus SS14]|nr:hypothetical protein M422DRAFT_26586 [Sphaerobolus stellatus SS14]